MRYLLIILTATLLFSCDKSDEPIKGIIVDTAIEFSVSNSQNVDLLNPENPNHIDAEGIKLFYVIDGETKEVYDQNMDAPRNFHVYKHENGHRIRVFLNDSETSDKPITYIQWSDIDTDTIEAIFKRPTNGIFVEKVWLNGDPIWERGDNTIDAKLVLTK
tara:strand:+ start:7015 stop:7494 length:480 start_codon:yes stop_codon:yes gene_type:complete